MEMIYINLNNPNSLKVRFLYPQITLIKETGINTVKASSTSLVGNELATDLRYLLVYISQNFRSAL